LVPEICRHGKPVGLAEHDAQIESCPKILGQKFIPERGGRVRRRKWVEIGCRGIRLEKLEFIESTMVGRNNEALKDKAGRSEEGKKIRLRASLWYG
jgi:hypothetical protein